MKDADLLAELDRVALARKVMQDQPEWVVSSHRSGDRLRIVCPLWIDEEQPSGLRLVITCPSAVPAERRMIDMVAMLFATVRGRDYHLGRIEFDPPGPGPHHRNRHMGKDVPPEILGPHVHPYEANRRFGIAGLTPAADGNLPFAFPLDRTIVNFSDALQSIWDHFDIPELWIGEPQWSIRLV
ncbi:hypothetical protein [Mesorhizobium sp.]|uniref:hypothetical protein n=1 Tax=Mesorhizobium sp. TaxID=1871066 RepID=UPI000FEA2376|nr:hypothetical protein [Mesorhizobium sp.]RWN58456.1 MAG: hypothetical protein EOS00_21230 [Mesorhizobium sp.]